MLSTIAWWVSVLGALNIGITAAFGKDFITALLGGDVTRIVYIVVGLSAVWMLLEYFKLIKK